MTPRHDGLCFECHENAPLPNGDLCGACENDLRLASQPLVLPGQLRPEALSTRRGMAISGA